MKRLLLALLLVIPSTAEAQIIIAPGGSTSTYATICTGLVDTYIVFTDGTGCGQDAELTWNKTTNNLLIAGTAQVTRLGIGVAADTAIPYYSSYSTITDPAAKWESGTRFVTLTVTNNSGHTLTTPQPFTISSTGSGTALNLSATGSIATTPARGFTISGLSNDFASLTITGGTNTTGVVNVLNLTGTWNGGTGAAIFANMTKTSGGGNLIDLQVSSASKFAIGNTGLVASFGGITTAGMGVAPLYGAPAISATKTANFTVLTYTPPATAGQYRAHCNITTTSATNTGTVQVTIDYVDSQGTTHTADIIPLQDAAGTWATTKTGASKEFYSAIKYFSINNSATAIVPKIVITGTVSYTCGCTVEQVQ